MVILYLPSRDNYYVNSHTCFDTIGCRIFLLVAKLGASQKKMGWYWIYYVGRKWTI